MRVRVSIGNLAPVVRINDFGNRCPVGILNSGSYKKGKKLIQPIGGAATLTPEGQQYVEYEFGATDFHTNTEGGIDARFVIDDSRLDEVLAFFTERDNFMFETDPLREICEELASNEFPANEHFKALAPILTPDEAAQIEVNFMSTVVQPFKDSGDTSPLAGKEPSRRLFHLFEIIIPDEATFQKLLDGESTYVLGFDEIATVEGGLKKGETLDGITIADNFILP